MKPPTTPNPRKFLKVETLPVDVTYKFKKNFITSNSEKVTFLLNRSFSTIIYVFYVTTHEKTCKTSF